MVVKRQRRGKAHENRTKEGQRTGVRTSGRTNSTPGLANLHRAGLGAVGAGVGKNIKRGAKGPGPSLLFASLDQYDLRP